MRVTIRRRLVAITNGLGGSTADTIFVTIPTVDTSAVRIPWSIGVLIAPTTVTEVVVFFLLSLCLGTLGDPRVVGTAAAASDVIDRLISTCPFGVSGPPEPVVPTDVPFQGPGGEVTATIGMLPG